MIFELAPGENVVVNNIVFMGFIETIGPVVVASWKFGILKTSTFALGQIFVLRTSNFRGAIGYEMATRFFSFPKF